MVGGLPIERDSQIKDTDAPSKRRRAARKTVRLEPSGPIRLLDADPDLGRHLTPEVLTRARRFLIADTLTLNSGRWWPRDEWCAPNPWFGLLVIDGALVRRVTVGGRSAVELLGPGDFLRPDQTEADEYANVRHSARWSVLEQTRVAVLDGDAVAGIAGLPGVLSELAGRAVERSHSVVLRMAIADTPRLADRLDLLLWHLADRWGRREGSDVVLTLRLPHELIAALASAQRTSVGAALHVLEERGLAAVRPDGRMVLRGSPPGMPKAGSDAQL